MKRTKEMTLAGEEPEKIGRNRGRVLLTTMPICERLWILWRISQTCALGSATCLNSERLNGKLWWSCFYSSSTREGSP
jgi:hypothetical protein